MFTMSWVFRYSSKNVMRMNLTHSATVGVNSISQNLNTIYICTQTPGQEGLILLFQNLSRKTTNEVPFVTTTTNHSKLINVRISSPIFSKKSPFLAKIFLPFFALKLGLPPKASQLAQFKYLVTSLFATDGNQYSKIEVAFYFPLFKSPQKNGTP